MIRAAAIDVGSNSVKLHVADLGPGSRWAVVVDRTDITRLGEGLRDTGLITESAMERTLAALARFVAEARSLGAVHTVAVGTMCLREAANADRFVEVAKERTGLAIEVIDGEEEARLSYLAVVSGLPVSQDVVVFDTGGGSTEFTLGRGGGIERRFSLNLGAVALTQEFLRSDPVTPGELEALRAHLEGALSGLEAPGKRCTLVGMGGTVTTMAAVKLELAPYDPDVVHGTMLTRAEVRSQVARYRETPLASRRAIVGLHPKRADIILAGAAIVLAVLDRLDADHMLVSDRGLRHGLLFDRFVGQVPLSS